MVAVSIMPRADIRKTAFMPGFQRTEHTLALPTRSTPQINRKFSRFTNAEQVDNVSRSGVPSAPW
jgi:hypothetical protein